MNTPQPIDDGGPAFPISEHGLQGYNGMSLRDWFAGQALAGSLASQTSESHWAFQALPNDNNNDTGALTGVARLSYAIADAMIAARGILLAKKIVVESITPINSDEINPQKPLDFSP